MIYEMIAIDSSKQQALDADPKAIQQINFTANLDQDGNTTIFFTIEEAEGTVLYFSQGIMSSYGLTAACSTISLFNTVSIQNDSI